MSRKIKTKVSPSTHEHMAKLLRSQKTLRPESLIHCENIAELLAAVVSNANLDPYSSRHNKPRKPIKDALDHIFVTPTLLDLAAVTEFDGLAVHTGDVVYVVVPLSVRCNFRTLIVLQLSEPVLCLD